MTTTLLTEKNCEAVIDYIQSKTRNPDNNQFAIPNVFNSPLIVRNLLFNSQLLLIAEIENSEVKKLFGILLPPNNTEELYCTIAALYIDFKFLTEALEIIEQILEDDDYKKLRFVADDSSHSDFLIQNLNKTGFELEAELKLKDSIQFYYSYFLR